MNELPDHIQERIKSAQEDANALNPFRAKNNREINGFILFAHRAGMASKRTLAEEFGIAEPTVAKICSFSSGKYKTLQDEFKVLGLTEFGKRYYSPELDERITRRHKEKSGGGRPRFFYDGFIRCEVFLSDGRWFYCRHEQGQRRDWISDPCSTYDEALAKLNESYGGEEPFKPLSVTNENHAGE